MKKYLHSHTLKTWVSGVMTIVLIGVLVGLIMIGIATIVKHYLKDSIEACEKHPQTIPHCKEQ